MRLLCKALSTMLLSSAMLAQSPSSPSFLAADVHASVTTGSYRNSLLPGGRYLLRNATLVRMISLAWGIDREAVSGGPAWLDTDTFDVTALTPPEASGADRALMLRTLLAERFGLTTHEDTKRLPVLALVLAKKGPPLKRSAVEGLPACSLDMESGPALLLSFACQHTTMAALAARLRSIDASITWPVVDGTGLEGWWDVTIRFTPLFEFQRSIAAGDPSPGIKLFDGLEKTGLRLEPRDQAIPVRVVDRANRTPTPNAADIAERLPAAKEFEAATIKPANPGAERKTEIQSAGRIEIIGFSLRELIRMAWELDADRVLDGPKWMDTDLYDVIAKAPPNTPPEDGDAMLKSLLTERFQLTTHTTDRPLAVFLLTAGKNPKLKDADPASRSRCTISRGQTGNGAAAMPLKVYTCQNTTMAKFAELIRPQAAGYIRNPVVDQTGLKGAYDFTLSWTRNDVIRAAQSRTQNDGPVTDPTGAITVFEALEHQLGLKLEDDKKYPLPVLVVDRAERITEAQ